MPGRLWSVDEAHFVSARIRLWTVGAIARHLGRSERAVRHWCERNRVAPTRDEWVTSGIAAELTGLSPQALTKAARAGRVRARRVPGGRWWLFDPASLPVRLNSERAGSSSAGRACP